MEKNKVRIINIFSALSLILWYFVVKVLIPLSYEGSPELYTDSVVSLLSFFLGIYPIVVLVSIIISNSEPDNSGLISASPNFSLFPLVNIFIIFLIGLFSGMFSGLSAEVVYYDPSAKDFICEGRKFLRINGSNIDIISDEPVSDQRSYVKKSTISQTILGEIILNESLILLNNFNLKSDNLDYLKSCKDDNEKTVLDYYKIPTPSGNVFLCKNDEFIEADIEPNNEVRWISIAPADYTLGGGIGRIENKRFLYDVNQYTVGSLPQSFSDKNSAIEYIKSCKDVNDKYFFDFYPLAL